jgi:hypothetical protein
VIAEEDWWRVDLAVVLVGGWDVAGRRWDMGDGKSRVG